MRSALGFRRAAVIAAHALPALLIVAGFLGYALWRFFTEPGAVEPAAAP